MNMSYCRFQNTLNDLKDCQENLTDQGLSRDEFAARKRLIKVCREMVDEAEGMDLEKQTFEEQT